MSKRPRILIRCNASAAVGFGHLIRCLALADQLREQNDWQVEFCMNADPVGVKGAQDGGYVVHQFHASHYSPESEGTWLKQCVETIGAQVLILDVRGDLPSSTVKAIRKNSVLIVSIDDSSARRMEADLVFYPPVPQLQNLDWNGFKGERYVGWEWILMPAAFAAQRKKMEKTKKGTRILPRVLVTMGGSDPAGLTLKALVALDILPNQFELQLVIGPGFVHQAALQDWLAQPHRPVELIINPKDFPAIIAQADLALAAFGATAYELATLAVPSIYLCLSEDHASSVQALVNAGAALSLGVHDTLHIADLSAAVGKLLENKTKIAAMRKSCHNLIDGGGAVRTALAIASKLEGQNANNH